MGFYSCPYCDGTEDTPLDALQYQNAKLITESEEWRRRLQAEVCQNAPLRKQNADLLAALSEIEAQCANVSNGAFDSRGAVRAIAAIVKTAKAKGETTS